MYYFAYGSNVSSRRLQARVPSARKVGVGVLERHVLKFHKASRKDGSAKCDACVSDSEAHLVHGVVFDIAGQEKAFLDSVEGPGYALKNIRVMLETGEPVDAYMYYATDIDPTLRPWHWYRQHVLSGALEHSLPDSYVEQIREVIVEEDPDRERHLRELAIYEQWSATGRE
jgi:hypothetical protein